MRTQTRLLLALGLVATLALPTLPGTEAVPENRAPHALLGQPQSTADSLAPCQSTPTVYTGCRLVYLNFNQSWDPDLEGFKFTITYTTAPVSTECTFLSPFIPTGNFGEFVVIAPIIEDPHIAKCVNTLQVVLDDGHGPDNPPNNPPNNCCATGFVDVTILNGNEPPKFDCNPETGACVGTALAVGSPTSLTSLTAPLSETKAKVNLVLDRGLSIPFTAYNVQDDRETVTMEVYVAIINQVGFISHYLVVPMHKCGPYLTGGHADPYCPKALTAPIDRKCCVNGPSETEVSDWVGFLPVDTRELVVGSYVAFAKADDANGGTTWSPFEMIEIEVESVAGGNCGPPCIDINPPVYLTPGYFFQNRQVGVPHNGLCFPFAGPPEQYRETFALGHGETLRPIITAPTPPADEVDPSTGQPYQLTDPSLLLRKVTYQTCSEVALGSNANRTAVYGDETPIQSPYYVGLDTLFSGDTDQEVAIIAYDRLGGINYVVVRVITDTTQPPYLIQRPETTYRDVPFQFSILVHDRLFTEVSLHITDYEGATDFERRSTSETPYITNVTVPNQPWLKLLNCGLNKTKCDVGQLSVTTVPTLAGAIRYDIGGKHDFTSPCSYLVDFNADKRLDFVFDPVSLSVKYPLLQKSGSGGFTDYVVDTNQDFSVGSTEEVIKGAVNGTVQDSDKCVLAFGSDAAAAFLNADDTQVFSYTLTRHQLGNASYRVGIRDIAFNNDAAPAYDFTYPAGCKGKACHLYNSTLTGQFTTDRALVDASVTELNVSAGPILVGDPVWVNATVRQGSKQVPEPHAIMVFGIDDAERFACLDKVLQAANLTDVPASCQPLQQRVAACPGTSNSTVPLQNVATKCYSLMPASFAGQGSFLRLALGLPGPPVAGDCPAASDTNHTFNVCSQRPDFSLPEGSRDRELRLPYAPGPHRIQGRVFVTASVNDTVSSNDYKEASFEVYLGRVVQGSVDAFGHAKGSGKEYYIKADCPASGTAVRAACRSTPQLSKGAVKVNAAGEVQASYDLRFTQNGTLRYEFSPDGGKTLLYWEPDHKQAVDRSLCGFNDTVTAPCMRPITVVPVVKTTSSSTKSSPDLAVVAPVAVALVAGLFARRRR